jgi:hypothetical protein
MTNDQEAELLSTLDRIAKALEGLAAIANASATNFQVKRLIVPGQPRTQGR